MSLRKSEEWPETKGLAILYGAKECARISKQAGYKPFRFSQLQNSAQPIETERFRESICCSKSRRMRKRLKIKVSGETAPKKEKRQLGCSIPNTCLPE